MLTLSILKTVLGRVLYCNSNIRKMTHVGFSILLLVIAVSVITGGLCLNVSTENCQHVYYKGDDINDNKGTNCKEINIRPEISYLQVDDPEMQRRIKEFWQRLTSEAQNIIWIHLCNLTSDQGRKLVKKLIDLNKSLLEKPGITLDLDSDTVEQVIDSLVLTTATGGITTEEVPNQLKRIFVNRPDDMKTVEHFWQCLSPEGQKVLRVNVNGLTLDEQGKVILRLIELSQSLMNKSDIRIGLDPDMLEEVIESITSSKHTEKVTIKSRSCHSTYPEQRTPAEEFWEKLAPSAQKTLRTYFSDITPDHRDKTIEKLIELSESALNQHGVKIGLDPELIEEVIELQRPKEPSTPSTPPIYSIPEPIGKVITLALPKKLEAELPIEVKSMFNDQPELQKPIGEFWKMLEYDAQKIVLLKLSNLQPEQQRKVILQLKELSEPFLNDTDTKISLEAETVQQVIELVNPRKPTAKVPFEVKYVYPRKRKQVKSLVVPYETAKAPSEIQNLFISLPEQQKPVEEFWKKLSPRTQDIILLKLANLTTDHRREVILNMIKLNETSLKQSAPQINLDSETVEQVIEQGNLRKQRLNVPIEIMDHFLGQPENQKYVEEFWGRLSPRTEKYLLIKLINLTPAHQRDVILKLIKLNEPLLKQTDGPIIFDSATIQEVIALVRPHKSAKEVPNEIRNLFVDRPEYQKPVEDFWLRLTLEAQNFLFLKLIELSPDQKREVIRKLIQLEEPVLKQPDIQIDLDRETVEMAISLAESTIPNDKVLDKVKQPFVNYPQEQEILGEFWKRLTPEAKKTLWSRLEKLPLDQQRGVILKLIEKSKPILKLPDAKINLNPSTIDESITLEEVIIEIKNLLVLYPANRKSVEEFWLQLTTEGQRTLQLYLKSLKPEQQIQLILKLINHYEPMMKQQTKPINLNGETIEMVMNLEKRNVIPSEIANLYIRYPIDRNAVQEFWNKLTSKGQKFLQLYLQNLPSDDQLKFIQKLIRHSEPLLKLEGVKIDLNLETIKKIMAFEAIYNEVPVEVRGLFGHSVLRNSVDEFLLRLHIEVRNVILSHLPKLIPDDQRKLLLKLMKMGRFMPGTSLTVDPELLKYLVSIYLMKLPVDISKIYPDRPELQIPLIHFIINLHPASQDLIRIYLDRMTPDAQGRILLKLIRIIEPHWNNPEIKLKLNARILENVINLYRATGLEDIDKGTFPMPRPNPNYDITMPAPYRHVPGIINYEYLLPGNIQLQNQLRIFINSFDQNMQKKLRSLFSVLEPLSLKIQDQLYLIINGNISSQEKFIQVINWIYQLPPSIIGNLNVINGLLNRGLGNDAKSSMEAIAPGNLELQQKLHQFITTLDLNSQHLLFYVLQKSGALSPYVQNQVLQFLNSPAGKINDSKKVFDLVRLISVGSNVIPVELRRLPIIRN